MFSLLIRQSDFIIWFFIWFPYFAAGFTLKYSFFCLVVTKYRTCRSVLTTTEINATASACTHALLPFFSSFQQSKIHGVTMKAASGAIQLLFVLFFTPHATGTRKWTEFFFLCVHMYVWVSLSFLYIFSSPSALRLQLSREANADQMPFSWKRDFYLLVGTRLWRRPAHHLCLVLPEGKVSFSFFFHMVDEAALNLLPYAKGLTAFLTVRHPFPFTFSVHVCILYLCV